MTEKSMSVAILGPGAVGGFLAALFFKKGYDVLCIGREEEVGAITKDGIKLKSKVFGDIASRPQAFTRLDREPDVLFITVKAPYLRKSLERIPKEFVSNTVIIPLLNGLGHVEILREYFGPRVAVGMIGAIEVSSETTGRIFHMTSQIPYIELASDKDIGRERLEKIAEMLKSAGLSVSILNREAEVIWRKLVRLNAIAVTTAAAQKPVGFVRSDPEWRKKLEACIHEGATVAQAEGVLISPEEVIKQIDALPPDLTTSLQRDIAKGVPSELEAIPGGVLLKANLHRISCPIIEELYRAFKKD